MRLYHLSVGTAVTYLTYRPWPPMDRCKSYACRARGPQLHDIGFWRTDSVLIDTSASRTWENAKGIVSRYPCPPG